MNNTQKLFQAVKDGNFQEFMHLVNEGADIYAHDEQGHSLCYYAEGCGFASILEALEMLESVNAKKIEEPDVRPVQPEVEDVAVVESEPSRPQAMSKGDILQLVKSYSPKNDEQFNAKKQVLDLLTGKDLDVNKLILNAVLLRSQELVQFAIDKNADVDVCDGDGEPLIVYAARRGMVDVVKMLIAAGAYVNAKYKDGCTALHAAVCAIIREGVKVLLEAGAYVNAKDNSGQTALYKAVLFAHFDSVKELLEAGADVNAKDEDGRTALHVAAYSGQLECVKVLLKAGADVNAETWNAEICYGMTALHCAVYNGQLECVKVLLEAGVDVNVKMDLREYVDHLFFWPQRNFKMTALDLARHCEEKEIAKLLKQAGGKSFWYGPIGHVLGVFSFIVCIVMLGVFVQIFEKIF